jgi:HD superfamily phosphohydrolase
LSTRKKILNDPIYGFITVPHPTVLALIDHPWFQRLRYIKQLGLGHLVYPGALHTRFHHALGAMHLMGLAIGTLRDKGHAISDEEALGAAIAILLHDVGHGPFSHALEHSLVEGIGHEDVSALVMDRLNAEMGGALELGLRIFRDQHPRHALHQLVSSQLDVDRMDYLNRDSFFTGVAEGVIGYDRIIKMLVVHEGQLMVEEKAIYSIEKFLVSRRLMYWQVYLHKTVIAAEQTLVRILRRARTLKEKGVAVAAATPEVDFFLGAFRENEGIAQHLDRFCRMDDHDLMATLKNWSVHPDRVLATLCRSITERNLLKCRLQSAPPDPVWAAAKTADFRERTGLSEEEAAYFVFTGEARNTTYNPGDERIQILFKDGQVRDISDVDNALIDRHLNMEVKKHYICFPR